VIMARGRGTGAAAPEQDRLSEVGIGLVGHDSSPMAHAECVRIARRLHAARQKVIGFIPATEKVAVPPVALQIGTALVELTGATIAFVDANVRYPALSEIAGDEAEPEPAPEIAEEASLLDQLRAAQGVFRTRWLRGSLAVLTPPGAERAGEAVPALARLLLDGIDLFEYVLVDLTGFDLLGEHASAAACMDAVVLVGQAHRTRERDMLRFVGEMPRSRFLGVLLVG
jgi:hypothetical protein